MKIKVTKFDNFNNVRTVVTTKLEANMLKTLKTDLYEDGTWLSQWHPEKLGEERAVAYATALGHSGVKYNGIDNYMSTKLYNIVEAPTDLEVIIAGYRMLGRYRKVSRILRECNKRGIEVSNMIPGHQ
jgi:hypothetical protein